MHKIGYMRPPRASQDASSTAQDGFCLRFGRQLEAKLEPCWPLFPPKTVPWRLLDDPRCPQESFGSPKMAHEASKPAPEPSRLRFWTIFHRFLVHFWLIFGSFLIVFWLIFNPFFIDFSHHFKIQWDRMGHVSDNPFRNIKLTNQQNNQSAVAGSQLCCALDR